MSDAEINAAAASLMRFERMRSIPALIVLGALTLLGAMVLPAPVAITFGAGFLVMGILSLIWISRARRVAVSAQRLTLPYLVDVSDKSIAVTQAGTRTTLPWEDMLHVTGTKDTWIFVPRRNSASILLPIRAVTDAEAGQLTALLSAWPARKYRRSAL
jgi:hypothetical protein